MEIEARSSTMCVVQAEQAAPNETMSADQSCVEGDPENYRIAYLKRAGQAARLACFTKQIEPTTGCLAAARRAEAAWARLADDLVQSLYRDYLAAPIARGNAAPLQPELLEDFETVPGDPLFEENLSRD